MTDVVIRRRLDGKYLTHRTSGGHARFGDFPQPIRSEGIAVCILRVDLGEDLADYEIVPAETVPVRNASS